MRTLEVMDETQLEQYVLELSGSFEFFCSELWKEIGLPNLAEHQRQIARWLQIGPRRRGVRAFRGASKTWVTLGYCAWVLFNDPQHKILLVSKSEKHSRDSLFMLRRWIGQVTFLQHLRPERKKGQRDSATKFDVGPADNDRTPSFTAASVTGQITGSRANTIVGDDAETSENTLTREQRERLREQVKEFENVLIPGGSIVMLGTPHHQESLYDKLTEAGYVFQSWPARFPTEEERIDDLSDELQDALSSGKASPGDAVWPERFTHEELTEREASEGRSTFAMQYQMLTHLADGLEYPLRLEDFIVFPVQRDKAPLTIAWGKSNDRGGTTRIDEIPSLGFGVDGFYSPIMYSDDWRTYSGTKCWVDPSGKGKDKTGVAIVSHMNGYLYVKYVGGLEGGYSTETLEKIALLAKEHGAREIFVEDNFGVGMVRELLAPILVRHFVADGHPDMPGGWGASIDSIRVTGQKELRIIQSLEPLLNSHRIVIHPDVASNFDLQRQLTKITRQRNCLNHEDELESLAMCCKMWEDTLGVDPHVNADRRRQVEIEERLRQHYDEIGLATWGKPRWFQHH